MESVGGGARLITHTVDFILLFFATWLKCTIHGIVDERCDKRSCKGSQKVNVEVLHGVRPRFHNTSVKDDCTNYTSLFVLYEEEKERKKEVKKKGYAYNKNKV